MYIQEMGRIDADPNGAAVTAPSLLGIHKSDPQSLPEASGSTLCPGKNGAKCSRTPIDPTPRKLKTRVRILLFEENETSMD